MLALTLTDVRLYLHVLAAAVWVGGQLTLAGLVPALRPLGPEVTRTAARAFNKVAWPAFGVLVVTGVWNVMDERVMNQGAWATTLNVKYAVVLLSGASAYLHAKATTPRGLAVWGALTGLSALVALLLGVQLAG